MITYESGMQLLPLSSAVTLIFSIPTANLSTHRVAEQELTAHALRLFTVVERLSLVFLTGHKFLALLPDPPDIPRFHDGHRNCY